MPWHKTNCCTEAGTHLARESTDSESVMVKSIPADIALAEPCKAEASFASSGPILIPGGTFGNWEQISVPCQNNDGPKAGLWYEVNGLAGTGLGTLEDTLILFAWKQVVELWNDLDFFLTEEGVNGKKKVFSTYGSPGVGKSYEVWAWCLQIAWQKQLDVLWVHADKLTKATCIQKRGNIWYRYRATPSELSLILENLPAKVVVFDGYEYDMTLYKSCFPHLLSEKFPDRNVVVVSSLGAGLQPKHLGLRFEQFKQFEMDPWTLEQFLCACKSSVFFDSVRKYFDVDESRPSDAEMVETLVKQKFLLCWG